MAVTDWADEYEIGEEAAAIIVQDTGGKAIMGQWDIGEGELTHEGVEYPYSVDEVVGGHIRVQFEGALPVLFDVQALIGTAFDSLRESGRLPEQVDA